MNKFLIFVIIATLVISATGVYAYNNIQKAQLEYARQLFLYKASHPNMTYEQQMNLARFNFFNMPRELR